VYLPHDTVSSRHCEVGRDEIGAWVRDLGSLNGTWVNDERLTGQQSVHRLRLDDVIRVTYFWMWLVATVPAEKDWLDWNDKTVRKIAQAINNDQAFDRLPILADALEEAGCTDPAILDHCRGPGPHVRGCWVVDLLLGKE
jgi:predicted component of type VI protein secretion system